MAARQETAGFSFVELALVVVILGLLVTLALPTYRESARRSLRTEAMRELLELAARQERFHAQYGAYAGAIVGTPGLNRASAATAGGLYDFSVVRCAGQDDFSRCYTLQAQPRGDQAADACGTLLLASSGQRAATGPAGGECW